MSHLNQKIADKKELEFAIFCIEQVAVFLEVDAERVFTALTKKSDILYGYDYQ